MSELNYFFLKLEKKSLDLSGRTVSIAGMEEQVQSNPEVFEIMQNEYIFISLYVDDRQELPEEEKFNYLKPSGGIKEIRTVGESGQLFRRLTSEIIRSLSMFFWTMK